MTEPREPTEDDPIRDEPLAKKTSDEIRKKTTKRAVQESTVSSPEEQVAERPQQSEEGAGFFIGDVKEIYKAAPRRTRAIAGQPINPERQGICFSGGGIRSASFSLGALQGLRATGAHATRGAQDKKIQSQHEDEFSKSEFLSAVSGGGYTAGALDMVRSHGVFNPEAPGLLPLAPGSLEEKHIRLHSSFVAHTFGEKLNLAMSLVVGIALNLFVVGLVLFLLLRPLGWFLHALEPGIISVEASIGVALVPAASVAWAVGGLLVVAAFLHYLSSVLRIPARSEVLSSTSHGALGLAALIVFLIVLIPISIWLFYVAVPWLKENVLVVRDFFEDGPGGDFLGLFVAGGSLAFIAVAARKQLGSIKITWWVRIAAFVIVPLILAWVVAVTVYGGVRVGISGTHWLLPEYWWWLVLLFAYCAMYLLVDPGRWSLNRFYRRRLEQAFAVQRQRSDIEERRSSGDANESACPSVAVEPSDNPAADTTTGGVASASSDIVSADGVSRAIWDALEAYLPDLEPFQDITTRYGSWGADAAAEATIPDQIAALLEGYPGFAVDWILTTAETERVGDSPYGDDPAPRIRQNLCLVLSLPQLANSDLKSAIDAVKAGVVAAVELDPMELASDEKDPDSPPLFDAEEVATVGSSIRDALANYFANVIEEITVDRVHLTIDLMNPVEIVAGLKATAQSNKEYHQNLRAFSPYRPGRWSRDSVSEMFNRAKRNMMLLEYHDPVVSLPHDLLVSALFRGGTAEPEVYLNSEIATAILEEIEVTVNRETASRGYVEPIPSPDMIRFSRPAQRPQFISSAAVNVSDSYATEPGLAAMSFAFDTLSVGSPPSSGIGTAATESYWVALKDRKRQADMSVPSVVAMSGAAISPGMEKRANRWLGAFMAIANARLSRWIPNPNWIDALAGDDGEWDDWPRITYIFKEIAGWYSTEDRYVNVTDGGFYDNMGLFELLNRGCGVIYAIDGSGAEPGVFSTIGQSMALASSELGIQFSINLDSLRGDDKTTAESYDEKRLKLPWRKRAAEARGGVLMDRPYVWGEYWSEHDDQAKGRICYIQTAVTKDAPWPVRSYWEAESDFPNHSTADQSFSYDEFEAYRELGYWAALEAKTHPDLRD